MFSDRGIVLLITLFNIFVNTQSLVELTPKSNTEMSSTEIVIRDTFNKLFTALRISNVGNKPRLKEYVAMYNFFITFTLKDCESLKETERLSRVYDIDNVRHFIALLNEILNESYDNDVILVDSNYETIYVEPVIKKLRYLKEIYEPSKTISNTAIDREILNNLMQNESNTTKDATNDELWLPNTRRVYRGRSVDISLFPFMASIHAAYKFRCGGAIIHNDFIITSATCLNAIYSNPVLHGNPGYLSVRVGSSYTESGGEKIGVHGIYFHHYFNPRTLEHNIALLRLSQSIRFGWSTTGVKRIDFDRSPSSLSSEGRNIIVLGWGARSSMDYKSHQLAYSILSRFPRRWCQKVYGKKHVSFRHFCGGSRKKKGGACRRDIGGPGIIGGQLVGIINFASDTCGGRSEPTVFTKVGFYARWIEDIIKKRAPYTQWKTNSSHNKTGMLRISIPIDLNSPGDEYLTMLRNFKDVSGLFARKASENLTDKTNSTVKKLTLE